MLLFLYFYQFCLSMLFIYSLFYSDKRYDITIVYILQNWCKFEPSYPLFICKFTFYRNDNSHYLLVLDCRINCFFLRNDQELRLQPSHSKSICLKL